MISDIDLRTITRDEFIEKVAEDCYAHLEDEGKEYIADHPNAIDHHFDFCLYIRNHYIHPYIDQFGFEVEPDSLSGTIMDLLITKITGDDPSDIFQYRLNSHREYCHLRKIYRRKFGEYPRKLTDKYRSRYPDLRTGYDEITRMLGIPCLIPERGNDPDDPKPLEPWEEEALMREAVVHELIMELAELLWQTDEIRKLAAECGIDKELTEERIGTVKNIFLTEKKYIPMGTVLLPFGDRIGEEACERFRGELITELDENPYLLEKLDPSLFHDRQLARAALKHSLAMGYLEEYRDDDEMVRYALGCDGMAIEYVHERYLEDRDIVRLAIEHSEKSEIMELDRMERYRTDKEFVYLSCKVNPSNFRWVDEAFRDDYDLVYRILTADNYRQSIVSSLSDRLKDDISVALLVVKADPGFGFEFLSERVRDSDEVALAVIEHKGPDSWEMYLMSDRIKGKYGFDKPL